MRTPAFNPTAPRIHVVDAVAVTAAAAYVALVVSLVARVDVPDWMSYLLPLPLLVPAIAFLRRAPLTPLQVRTGIAAGIALAAYVGAVAAPSTPLIVFALPAVAISGFVAARRPAEVFAVCLLCTGFFGSLDAFYGVPAAQVADLILLGLWLAALWSWWFGSQLRLRFLPSLLALGLYVVFSAGSILAADTLTIGLQAFRGSIWYLAVLLLAANAPWSGQVRERMLRAVALTGLAVGGYATLRWATGPAGVEQELAALNPNNVLDGELRPIGSFATSKELAFWMAIFTPFLFALGLCWRGRWRLVALAATGLCLIGMLAADVRAGPGAAAPALLAVLALYQLSQGFRGRRGPVALVIVAVSLLLGAGAFALTLGDKADTEQRYENILSPTQDASYQARLVKWRTALDDIDDAPLGHGLGTAGRTQKRFGVYANIGNVDVDNSYLKVAYEQGFVVMVLLVSVLLIILAALARGAMIDTDPARAGPQIAACGTLVAMLVIFYVGDYIEGLPALGGWLLVGLGLGQLARQRATGTVTSATP